MYNVQSKKLCAVPECSYPTGECSGDCFHPEEKQMILKFDEGRADIIGQNGNDGDHYDMVNHPKHYTAHPSGVECIQITEHMTFCLGNAMKYIWRADLKADAIEDLRKAVWYIEREIARRSKQ
jgi:hypothetical protein